MDYSKIVKKITDFLLKGKENTLKPVRIKGEGMSYCYDLTTMSFTKVFNNSEMYILPMKLPDKDKVCIYVPNIYGTGTLLRVNKEDIEYLGLN